MSEVEVPLPADRHEPADALPAALPPLNGRLMIALYAAVFMVSAEARVIAPLLPAIAQDFRTSVPSVGILITAYNIPYGLFQLVYGPLADRFSRQRVMGAALALFSVGTFVSGFAPNLPVLDILRLATGGAAAGVIPIALAYVGDAVPYERRQAVLGQVVSISAMGGVLSAALGGFIAALVSWRVLFIGYGALACIVSALLLRLPVTRVRTIAPRQGGLLGPYRAIFQQAGARAWALYGLVFFEGVAAISTAGYFGALLFERDGYSYALIGALLTISGVASMITGRFVGGLVRRIGERGMLLLGGAMMTFAYLLVGLQPTILFFPLAMVFSGAGFIVAHSTLQARATELVPSMRGTAVALFAFSLFIGGGLGTWLAGLAIDRFGYTLAILGTAVLLAMYTFSAGVLTPSARVAGEAR